MELQTFNEKWTHIHHNDKNTFADETLLFVAPGKQPRTQRQLNLYYYFVYIRDIFKNLPIHDVLEVGCGRGTMSLYLARYLQLSVSLLDSEVNAIEIAKKEFQAHKEDAKFFVADALKTQLPDQSYDATISIGLAEHIDDVKTLFQEQYRLLRNGGVMISLNIPKKFSIQYLNTLYRVILKMRGKYKENLRKDYYRNTLQVKDYIKIAEDVGFTNVQVTHVCPFPVYTPLSIEWDKRITKFSKLILKIKNIFQSYPYKTNSVFAQAHFLIGYKKI